MLGLHDVAKYSEHEIFYSPSTFARTIPYTEQILGRSVHRNAYNDTCTKGCKSDQEAPRTLVKIRASTFRIKRAIVSGLVRLLQSRVRNSWVQFGESANVVAGDEVLIDLLGPPGLACSPPPPGPQSFPSKNGRRPHEQETPKGIETSSVFHHGKFAQGIWSLLLGLAKDSSLSGGARNGNMFRNLAHWVATFSKPATPSSTSS